MLVRKLARHIRKGRLTVRGLTRSDLVFGQFEVNLPHLDVTIRVRGHGTAWRLASRPDLYLGEAYMDGSLVIERGSLRSFLELCFINFRARAGRQSWLKDVAYRALQSLQQRNPRRGARRNAAHHYDLSGDLYRLFLDGDRQYSCAYFAAPGMSLDEAQRAKKAHIGRKLLLDEGQRVLDIGCGWGGLALSLAREGAGQVTGITLSSEQLEVARQRAAEAGLDHRVRFEFRDYRDATGPFERIVSVGMFEHVGTPNYQAFFDTIARLLTDDGVALLHSIGRTDGPGSANAWIRKYIFPGGYVPALSEVLPAIERAGLWATDVEIWRLHYADTLRHWQERFAARREEVARIYDERFCRMWEFYLAACEMGFRYDHLMVFQLQLAKRVETVPLTRNYMYRGANVLPLQRVSSDRAEHGLDQAAD